MSLGEFKIDQANLQQQMEFALSEAKKAYQKAEVPIGAVVLHSGKVVSRAHNLTESLQDCTAHAELLAIRAAASELKNWRLNECILLTTLEPCSMCAGAIKLCRIPVVVVGCKDQRAGAVGSLYDLLSDERTGPAPRVIYGIKEAECRQILQEFFKAKRISDKN